LLVEPRLVLAEALLELLYLRLHRLHLRHRPIGLVGKREEDELDQHRQQHDGDAEITDLLVEEVEGQEDRLGDPVEEAEVDRPVEARNAELALIAVEEMHLLGAGEDPVRAAHLAVRRHRLESAGVIGLIDLAVALAVEAYLGYDLLLLRRDEGGEPEFVGEAEPAADAGVPDRRL